MISFEKFLKEIKNKHIFFKIYGRNKTISSMAQYRSENLGDNEYIKILFDDKSLLVISLREKLLMYGDELIGRIKNIEDKDIGKKETIFYQGKKYNLINKNDHQKVKKLLYGDFSELEEEVLFSDYESEGDSTELLSLGWLAKNQKRADMHIKELKIKDIEIVN
jgi:hypothetical protein